MTREKAIALVAQIGGWVILAILWGFGAFTIGAGLGVSWGLIKSGWEFGAKLIGML